MENNENNENNENINMQQNIRRNIRNLNQILEQRRYEDQYIPSNFDINFENVDLQGVVYRNVNLSGANFRGANLSMGSLINVNLEGANLEGANLQGTDFTGSNLQIANLQRAILIRANLEESHLSGARLGSADLSQSNLFGAELSNTDLTGADLSNTNLSFTDFYTANLDRTIFTNARIHRTIFIDAQNIDNAIDLNIDDNFDDGELDEDVIRVPGADLGLVPHVVAPRGLAYEIHDAFIRFQPKIPEFLSIINQPDKEVSDIYSYINEIFTSNIRQLFPDDNGKISEFNTAFNKINGDIGQTYKDLIERYKELIVKSIDFAFSQDDHFKEEYIKAFLDETCHAYAGANGTSCIPGIIERFTMCIGSAVQILCVDGCENVTYQALDKLFNPKFDIDKSSTKWWETMALIDEVKNMSKEERKEHFKNYLREKARELNNYNDYIEQEIIRYADNIDYSFEELILGGTSRKTRNPKKSRKTRRVKSRKSKKTIKTSSSKRSKKSHIKNKKNKKTKKFRKM